MDTVGVEVTETAILTAAVIRIAEISLCGITAWSSDDYANKVSGCSLLTIMSLPEAVA